MELQSPFGEAEPAPTEARLTGQLFENKNAHRKLLEPEKIMFCPEKERQILRSFIADAYLHRGLELSSPTLSTDSRSCHPPEDFEDVGGHETDPSTEGTDRDLIQGLLPSTMRRKVKAKRILLEPSHFDSLLGHDSETLSPSCAIGIQSATPNVEGGRNFCPPDLVGRIDSGPSSSELPPRNRTRVSKFHKSKHGRGRSPPTKSPTRQDAEYIACDGLGVEGMFSPVRLAVDTKVTKLRSRVKYGSSSEEEQSYDTPGNPIATVGYIPASIPFDPFDPNQYPQEGLQTIPLDYLSRLNFDIFKSQPCATGYTHSNNAGPVTSAAQTASFLTCMNWYGYHRAHNLPLTLTGVDVTGVRGIHVKLENKFHHASFAPYFPLTQGLQATLLDAMIKAKASLGEFVADIDQRLHIFVDISNIVIGWIECLKQRAGLLSHDRVRAPPFCFPNLHRIICRGRRPELSFAVGSSSSGQMTQHFDEAEKLCGYQVMNMPRLQVSPTAPFGQRRQFKEHFVDETLHIRMADSILDSEPGTMVLATGDGNVAEYSQGFHTWVVRALDRGWKVELVAFRDSINKNYLDPSFRNQYGDKFSVIELNSFADLLFAMWASA